MSDGGSDIRSKLDEIVTFQDALRARYPSDPQGVQQALEGLRVRAAALLGSADRDAHEAVQFELYSLVESAQDICQVFQSLRDAEIAEILRRAIEDLQRIEQERPLTEHELENLRAAQAFYEDVIRGGGEATAQSP